MGASICCAEAEADTQFTIFDLSALKKQCLIFGFKEVIRPDHGRMIWGEQGKAGYCLYDRALGATYLMGLWEALQRQTESSHLSALRIKAFYGRFENAMKTQIWIVISVYVLVAIIKKRMKIDVSRHTIF